jgi:hypothetical protein
VERTGEGDRAKQAEVSAAEKDLKTARIFQTISAQRAKLAWLMASA